MAAPAALTRYHGSLGSFLQWQLQLGSLASLLPSQFLDLRVTAVDPEADLADDLQSLEEESLLLKESRFSIRALALLKKPNRRILLTGVSGAGKTVALGSLTHRLTATASAALNAGIDPDYIPLWTPTSDLPEIDFHSLVDWLAGRLQDGGVYSESERLAESLLGSGCLVLFLDSLHEVVGISPARTRTLGRLAALPRVRIVASARPGYELLGAEHHCDVFYLEGLNPAERNRILGSGNLSSAKRDQLHRLAIEPRLRRAVEVPQIWQMAIALAKDGVDLTNVTQEATLYERFFQETLNAPHLATPSPYLLREVEVLIEMLGARSAFHGGQDVLLNEANDLVERWASCDGRSRNLLYPHDWPQLFVDHLPRFFQPILRTSGKERAIGFAHGSLAEFLAARWILRLWRIVPPELLPIPELADLISFAAQLQELRGANNFMIGELDAGQVRRGSLPLLLSWLRQTPKERIEAIEGEVQLRIWYAARNEAWQILTTLGTRGESWAERIMGSLLNSVGEEQARWFRRAIHKGARRNRALIDEDYPGGRERKRGDRKGSKATAVKDMPAISGPIPSLETLRSRLQSEDASVRAVAARMIGLSGRPAAAHDLIPLLDLRREGNSEVRGRVATALGRLGNPEAVPELIARLDPTKETEGSVRGRVARSLGFLTDLRAVEGLVQRLDPREEPNDVVRGAAINALGALGDSRALEGLFQRLSRAKESDPKNRGAAAKALGSLGNTSAVVLLLACLDPKREPDSATRGSAATALGALGDARAVEPLLSCLDPNLEPGSDVRGSAATALGALGDARAVEPLFLCLDPKREPDPAIRGAAATALGALGDARAVEPLLLCLDPKQELGVNVRGSAATALGALGDARAVAPLLLGLDPNRESNAIVRKSAAAALRKLDRKGNAGSLLPQTDVETKSQAKDAIVAKPPENAALKAFWEDLLEDFFLWTETPLESSFPRELERCLLSLERYLGGADSRGWSEKDYQRVLAALLAKDRGGVVTEAEPADRERTDILAQLNDGSQTVLELKFDDPKRLAEQLAQLRQYLASFKSDDRPTSGHLILLDRNPRPSWGEKQRRTEEDGISVWRVHVNRQPASKRTVSPDPAGRGSGAEGPVGK